MMYFLKGIVVGIANIIPGVSGGTIAVVLGIFDKLIDAVNNFYKDLKRYAMFLLPLGAGMLFGIAAFSKLIEYCFGKYSFATTMFFVGLVVGSLPLIYSKATKNKPTAKNIFAAAVAFLAVVVIVQLKAPQTSAAELAATPANLLKFFAGGVIAAAAMVIPGISGSFVMVLLGLYSSVISSISTFISALLPLDMGAVIAPFLLLSFLGVGVIAGLLLISKIIELLMKKYHAYTYFSILGLMCGSIYGMFADPQTYASGLNALAVAAGVVALLAGLGISIVLGREK